jgi:uncharacterized phiE125 gp8 family phage protein
MARALSIVTPYTTAVISTATVKKHLKVDVTDDDTLIANLVTVATKAVETYTNTFILDTTVKMIGDTWSDISELYKNPVKSVSNIKYYDTTDTLVTLTDTAYLVDNISKPTRINLGVNQEWPNLSERKMAVEVNYVVGNGDTQGDAPLLIQQAMLLMIGNWYENRQAVVTGSIATEIPMAAKMLLDQYKVQVCR